MYSRDIPKPVFRIDSFPPEGLLLDKGWLYQPGDDPARAEFSYDDSKWQTINPVANINALPELDNVTLGWLRLHLVIDSGLLNRIIGLQVSQTVASEIFIDGKLLARYGKLNNDPSAVRPFQPLDVPLAFSMNKRECVLAVRFAVNKQLFNFSLIAPADFFQARLNDIGNSVQGREVRNVSRFIFFIEAGVFFILAFLHFCFYLADKKNKTNLYFSISTLALCIATLLIEMSIRPLNAALTAFAGFTGLILFHNVSGFFIYSAIRNQFTTRKNPIRNTTILAYCLAGVLILYFFPQTTKVFTVYLPYFITIAAAIIILIKAALRKERGAVALTISFSVYFILFLAFCLELYGVIPSTSAYTFSILYFQDMYFHFAVLSLPIAFSLYLARDFTNTSKDLEKKLAEVERLSEEKQQILAGQKETLELQVKERTNSLTESIKELKQTQAQLIQSEKMASLGQLTAGIAHEIQNPLNFVNNFSEVNGELMSEMKAELAVGNLQSATEIAGDIEQNLEKINHHGKRAESIVKGMLEHSRQSTGEKQPTDINALADEYLKLAYNGLKAKDKNFNAVLKTDFDNTIGKIDIVAQDIGRVLLNLYNNAFYAVSLSAAGGFKETDSSYIPTVTVSTKKFGETILISVKDNGPGIPDNIKDKIFQPFFTTKPTGQGTGLGLSLSYDIIGAHGGELKVASRVSEGAAFTIVLPAHS